MNNDFLKDGYAPLGFFLVDTIEKTASDKACENLVIDNYLAGFEDRLSGGIPTAMEKVAYRDLGRTIMSDLIPRVLLNK